MAAATLMVATSALSAPWNKDNLTEHIDKTNFILDDRCSGTLIDLEDKIILTAYHCVADRLDSSIEVKQHIYEENGEIYSMFMTQAYVVAVDKYNDLALIRAKTSNMPYDMQATISWDEVSLGDDVWVVGNPLVFLDNSLTKGVISALHRVINNKHVWQIDANIVGGNSGGGVYNSNGELIGVTSAGMMFQGRIPIGFNFIVPLEYIQKLVVEYNDI